MQRIVGTVLLGFILFASASASAPATAWANEICDLAGTVSEKAAKIFAKDKEEGLKLFIKAAELCPSETRHAQNLASAYYQYGRLVETQQHLELVVEKDERNAVALGNLAQVILERQGDTSAALRYANRAIKLAPEDAAVQETLAHALFFAGKKVEALTRLRSVLGKGSDPRLAVAHTNLLDQYISAQLTLVKSGKEEQGLKGLAALPDEPAAARTRAQVLARLGRGEEALAAIATARQRYPNDNTLASASDEVAGQVTAALYSDFQSGQGAQSVARAKKISEANPGMFVLRQAYDKLFDAMMSDAKTISVPEAVARAGSGVTGGRADALLADLGGGSKTQEVDLNVDIDQQIPNGQRAGRYDVAVVIGNRTYGAGGTPNVDYALRDARVMRQYMEKTLGFDPGMIIYEEDAGYVKFIEIFGNERDHQGKLFRYVKEGESRVFVYYVGHGAPDATSGEAYFVPVDANPEYLKTSGYRLQTFYDNLSKLPAKDVTVVLDACFSGNSAKGLLLKGVSGLALKPRDVQEPMSATVFTSARDDQYSAWYPEKRHSLFTYFFLKGLRGEADKDGDRKVTVAEMEKYLDAEVAYQAKKIKGTLQNPTVSGSRERVLAILK